MTRDRGYPDWLVLSARLLRSGYHSAGCVWLVAMCSLLLYVVIFVTMPSFCVNLLLYITALFDFYDILIYCCLFLLSCKVSLCVLKGTHK